MSPDLTILTGRIPTGDELGTLHHPPEIVERKASVSPCGTYRWWLSRKFEGGTGAVTFVMLNPSKADHTQDDPTMVRVQRFASAWGFNTVMVVNLFPLRSSDPRDVLKAGVEKAKGDPTGLDVIRTAVAAQLVVAAWGAYVPFGRDDEVLAAIPTTKLMCLGRCK